MEKKYDWEIIHVRNKGYVIDTAYEPKVLLETDNEHWLAEQLPIYLNNYLEAELKIRTNRITDMALSGPGLFVNINYWIASYNYRHKKNFQR